MPRGMCISGKHMVVQVQSPCTCAIPCFPRTPCLYNHFHCQRTPKPRSVLTFPAHPLLLPFHATPPARPPRPSPQAPSSAWLGPGHVPCWPCWRLPGTLRWAAIICMRRASCTESKWAGPCWRSCACSWNQAFLIVGMRRVLCVVMGGALVVGYACAISVPSVEISLSSATR